VLPSLFNRRDRLTDVIMEYVSIKPIRACRGALAAPSKPFVSRRVAPRLLYTRRYTTVAIIPFSVLYVYSI
jgi:hypothetical protein